MYPSILIFGKSVFLCDILENMGTVLGLCAMLFMLHKYGTRDKRAYISLLVTLAVSFPFSRLIRGLSDAESLGEIFSSGVSIVGMVFAYHFLFDPIYRIICKEKPNKDIKGFGAIFFTIQHFFSRLGCFSLGCCFGKPYNGLFSITFPYGTEPYSVYGGEIPIFPSQLFESFSALAILILSAALISKGKKAYSPFIILFSAMIFISEIFIYRYDYERTVGSLSFIQIACVILILTQLINLLIKHPKKKPLPTSKKT